MKQMASRMTLVCVSRCAFIRTLVPRSFGLHQIMTQSTFSNDEVQRYSRQLILPEIGMDGQRKLKSASVLIVGAGGLGCPASQYLAAAGIGRIGLMDADVVEMSNLHRQILHRENGIGTPKTESVIQSLAALNSNVMFDNLPEKLSRENALQTVQKYDIVVDATDNVVARYLISDVCVLAGKPLVSGSALRFDGQLTVYNYDEHTPCYRCLFPTPPPPGTVTNCSDGGVLGVVPGIIGSIQALETIKLAVGMRPAYAGIMLLFDGLTGVFRNIRIRSKARNCASCSANRSIGPELMDYESFCGTQTCSTGGLKILLPFERLSVHEYKNQVLDRDVDHILIDVRPKVEADIVKLDHALSVPLPDLTKADGTGLRVVRDALAEKKQVYVMCRRGNASQKAVRFLKDRLAEETESEIKDLTGGLDAWRTEIDPSIPSY